MINRAIPIKKIEARINSLKDELAKPGISNIDADMKRGAIKELEMLLAQYWERKGIKKGK